MVCIPKLYINKYQLQQIGNQTRALIVNNYVISIPTRFSNRNMASQKRSVGVNVICDGSPSRMRIVLLISLGITTRPRSSILLTIPVAFIIYINLLVFQIGDVSICKTRGFILRGLTFLAYYAIMFGNVYLIGDEI